MFNRKRIRVILFAFLTLVTISLFTIVSVAIADETVDQSKEYGFWGKGSSFYKAVKQNHIETQMDDPIDGRFICNNNAETFDTDIPLNWTVVNNASGNPVVWTDISSCGESGNWASGNGGAACASSDQQGPTGLYDTELHTPSFDFTNVFTATLVYYANYANFANGDLLDLDVSIDSGDNWTNLLSWNEDHPAIGFRQAPGERITVNLDAFAHEPDIRFRWHYYDPVGPIESDDWYAQIDEVAFLCDINYPSIVIIPDSLASTQATNFLFTETLIIQNQGTGDLAFAIDERMVTGPANINLNPVIASDLNLDALLQTAPHTSSQASYRAEGIGNVLWNQPDDPGNANGGWSDYLTTETAGLYSADDFVLTDTAKIELIFADGFDIGNYLPNVPAIDWYIYSDAGGAPAGHPEDGGGSELWHYSSAPDMAGVDVTGNTITLDLVAAGEQLILRDDVYWLVVFPTYDDHNLLVGDPVWNWFDGIPADGSTSTAFVIDPSDYLGGGFTSWTPWSTLSAIDQLAFRIDGTYLAQACPATAELPWVTTTPNVGVVQPSGAEEIDVVFDSSGLAAGVYSGTLCITNNDPFALQTLVPISMTVTMPVYDVLLADDRMGTTLPGTVITYTLLVTNLSNVAANFDLSVNGEGWLTIIAPTTLSLFAGESQYVTVSVTVPPETRSGTVDNATLTVTAQADGAVNDSVMITTSVEFHYIYLPLIQVDD